MFENVAEAPPDPILGLTDAFNRDPNPSKINLSVGVYEDAQGKTPILETVKLAEKRLLESEASKKYKPISGDPEFGKLVQGLLFGADVTSAGGVAMRTAHTPGGTGALRVAADYLHTVHPQTTLWQSEPTWVNHPKVFAAAGVPLNTYPYFDPSTNGLNFDAMMSTLARIPAGDAVLLHGCCHNPTGVDPTAEQWTEIARVLSERKLLPVVDFAYQGLGTGLVEDGLGLKTIKEKCPELFICSSFSKNFGLYSERTGALTLVAQSEEQANRVFSQLKVCIRANYSNPPAHGASIVRQILADAELRGRWELELAAMRDRINGMRKLFVETLRQQGIARDFSFIAHQKGMFSFSGLTKEQVDALRDKYSIYVVSSGRINVAGMTESNMLPLCKAIASVL